MTDRETKEGGDREGEKVRKDCNVLLLCSRVHFTLWTATAFFEKLESLTSWT